MADSLANLMNNEDVLRKVLHRITKGDMNYEDKTLSTPLADIVSTSNEYIFYIDVPGLSKSDIQVICFLVVKLCKMLLDLCHGMF